MVVFDGGEVLDELFCCMIISMVWAWFNCVYGGEQLMEKGMEQLYYFKNRSSR